MPPDDEKPPAEPEPEPDEAKKIENAQLLHRHAFRKPSKRIRD